MKNLFIIICVIVLVSCTPKIYKKEELNNNIKNDSIINEYHIMLENEKIDDLRDNLDIYKID